MTDTPSENEGSVLYGDPQSQHDADSITLLRILDVLYAIYMKQYPKGAEKLVNLHSEGGLLGPELRYDPSKMLDKD